ncbi:MAG: T9SS type A sorting domain-containing protein, partial [Chitinophagales bacterium]|nr:T9SS type A sorting domain-containing protein [Chitinophagales bacterium]
FTTPALPVISQNGNLLTCSASDFYQWQFNSTDIPGATAQTYTATQTGFYSVVIRDQNGCASSSTVYIDLTGIEDFTFESGIEIIQGAGDGIIVLHSDKNEIANLDINVLNVLGQSVFHSSNISFSGNEEIDLSHLSPATYFVQLTLNNNIYNAKLILAE